MTYYKTTQGQTWDQVAFEVYGDDHKYHEIMAANPDFIDVLVFSSGIILNIPDETAEEPISKDYPAWRAELNGN